MSITRTAWIDEVPNVTTGTLINNAAKTSLYDQIDAALPNMTASDGQILFNQDGTLAGDAGLTFAGGALVVGNTLASPVAGLYVGPGTYVDSGNEPSVQIDPLNTNPNAYWAVEIGPIFTVPTKAGELTGIFYGAQIDRGVASGDDADRFFGTEQYVSLNNGVSVTHEVAVTKFYFAMNGNGSAEAGRGAWFYPPILVAGDDLPAYQAIWIDALGTASPNSYYFWADSQGVYRIKEDSVVDSGNAQAIAALYNPRFTKYTPGVVNFERVVQQWNGNVAEIGTEAGGSGVLRPLRLLGSGVTADSYETAATDTGSLYLGSPSKVNIQQATDAAWALTITNASKDPAHYGGAFWVDANGAFQFVAGKDQEVTMVANPSDSTMSGGIFAGTWSFQNPLVSDGAHSLGTAALPWAAVYATSLVLGGGIKCVLPTSNPGAGFLWNNGGVCSVGT